MQRMYGWWAKLIFISGVFSLCILFFEPLLAQCPNPINSCNVNPRIRKIDANISGRIKTYMEYLPLSYAANPTAQYPVLIFWPGLCEITGNAGGGVQALCTLLSLAIPRIINEGRFPEVVLDNNGQPFSFIVIVPQVTSTGGMDNPTEVNAVINYITNTYRADVSRIYTTGISIGGSIVMDHATSSLASAQKLAAISPLAQCFAPGSDFNTRVANLANANVRVWGIHCPNDWVCDDDWIMAWVNGINGVRPGLAQYTLVDECAGYHPAWYFAYEPTWKVNNKNVYEWLIQYSRGGALPGPISSIISGAWNSPSTWSCNCVPQPNSEVTIKTGKTVSITPLMGPIQVSKLVLETGSILNVTGSLKIGPN